MDTAGPRRRALLATLGLALGGGARTANAADPWPTRPVRIVVPFAPGGAADGSARVLGEAMAPALKQPVVVENKPGAGSAIGVVAAAQSKDGHTLLMGSNSMVINPSLVPQIGYDVERDFDAVGMVSAQPLVLVVPGDSPIRSVPELIAQAQAKPGTLTAGNSGNGTLAHLAAELFSARTGVRLTMVPYRGESALMPDMLGGLVALGFLNLPSVAPQIRAGKLRALAVSSAQPVAELPGVPTLRSLGYPELELQGWAALLAPKGSIDAAGLARLESTLTTALASEPIRTRFAALGVAPLVRTREQTAKFLRDEAARYAAVIKARGIKLE